MIQYSVIHKYNFLIVSALLFIYVDGKFLISLDTPLTIFIETIIPCKVNVSSM